MAEWFEQARQTVSGGGRTGDVSAKLLRLLKQRDEFRRDAFENRMERELLHMKLQTLLDRMIWRMS